jgi:hypothetical protein
MNSHRQDFENWPRHNDVPFVSVDEAKKALHGVGTLHSFHYVVYGEGDEPNLLCYVIRRPNHDHRFNMSQWQDVFGNGFAACFVNMDDDQPVFTRLDGETFTPSFMREAEPLDGIKEAILKAKEEGDDIALIEWLSDNDPLYADVEDAMAEAAERGQDAQENRLSDWLMEYRRCLIASEPVPEPPGHQRHVTPEQLPSPPRPQPQPFTTRQQLELFR